ncbi:MAG: outer membrane beta-barrel protein [Proteobacteria bacterium]|nr:outer membrane beta-barrel protein [Pseudomonadota bacterium]
MSANTPVALAQNGGSRAIDAQGVVRDVPQGPPAADSTNGTATMRSNTILGDVMVNQPGAAGMTGDPAITMGKSVSPAISPPAVAPPVAAGSTIPGAIVSTQTGAAVGANEVTSLPSYVTTIVNAPFGASSPVEPAIGSGVSAGSSELGISLGSFRLYPQLEVNTGADSNVFAQSASLGTVGSFYTTISPTFDLRSDWSNHALHILATGIAGFYASAPTQNYRNYTLQADGKIDIYTDFYATWSAAYKQNTEALGTPNVAFAQAPTVANSIPVSLSLYQRFNRLFYQLKGGMTRYTYTDFGAITVDGLPASSRDRTEFEESLRIGYDIFDDLALFVQPGLNQRRYVVQSNSADQDRDSDGQLVNVGATWSPSAATRLEATVGYQNQAYRSFGGSTGAVTFGLSGSWNGYAPLTLRPSIQRSVSETALSNYKNYVSTTYGLDFNYLIHDVWTAVGGVSLVTAAYTPVDGSGVAPRTDSIYRGQIGLLYSLRPQVQIGPFFEYTNGSSTDPTTGPGYDREIFSVRLIAKR